MNTQTVTPDVLVSNEGTVFVFCPLTPRAKQWIDENVSTEQWQWFGHALVVEQRYAWGLGQGMKDAGLQLAYGNSPIATEPKGERDTWEYAIDRACAAQAEVAAKQGLRKRSREEVEQFVLTVLMLAEGSKRNGHEN